MPISRTARWLLLAAAALGAALAAYQSAAEAGDRKRYPPPGRMVRVGRRSMHLIDMGTGDPAVVIVQALGTDTLDFLDFYRYLAGDGVRVIVYDRAGLGWSDAPPIGRRTADDMARELHDLLAAAGVTRPVVLAGHSFGGIIARRYAARYPGDVAGLVLIDSSHEDQVRRYATVEGRWVNPPVTTARRILKMVAVPLGLRRLLPRKPSSTAPPDLAGASRAINLTRRHRRSDIREMILSAGPNGTPPDLGDLPLTVLTAAGRDATWNAMQAELAAISTSSTHIIAAHGWHFLQQDNPDLVSGAIRDMISRVRDTQEQAETSTH
jgi:pimeloyl-ACP methyl ester carboxylesterase